MKKAKQEFLKKVHGGQVCQIVSTTARLGIAKVLPATLEEIATSLNLAIDPLRKLMKATVALRLVNENGGIYSLTEEGECLKTPLGDIAAYKGSAAMWGALGKLEEGIRTGDSPFTLAYGTSQFDYFDEHPAQMDLFQNAMTAYAEESSKQILAEYNFSECKRILDVGGGRGAFLKAILALHPHLEGDVFDRPGDFFKEIPGGYDTYVLRNILHDFDDEACLKLLKNCQKAERLLVFESLVGDGNLGTFSDLTMFVTTPGGKERTEEQLKDLLLRGGFVVREVHRSTASKALLVAVNL